jgi:hypothetical protein
MNYALIHRDGCGGLAFTLGFRPRPGEVAMARDITYPDGTHPQPGTTAICGTCKERISVPTPDQLVELIELRIPLLLPSFNRMGGAGRGHWTAWQKDKKQWSDWVMVAKLNQAKVYGQPRYERARVEIDRHCVQDIKDADNLRAGTKWLLDAIVGHGILKDDSREHIGEPVIRQVRCKRTDLPLTVVRIYPTS